MHLQRGQTAYVAPVSVMSIIVMLQTKDERDNTPVSMAMHVAVREAIVPQ